MIFKVVSTIFLVASFYSPLSLASEIVKIRIKSALQKVKVEGQTLNFQYKAPISPYQNVAIPRVSVAEVRLIRSAEKEFVWRVSYPNRPGEELQIKSHRLVLTGDRVHIGSELVPSKLYFYARENQKIDVVAELDIESYLAGVLPSEMPASWPIEALKAQAVASRSYMRNIMNSRQTEHFHLEASIHDQVYRAVNFLGAKPELRGKISRAIEETRGQYLIDEKQKVYRAFYHADCGGETEEPIHVWGMKQKNGTVKDMFCPQSPSSRWSLNLPKSEVVDLLRGHFNVLSTKELKALLIAQRSASGRIADIAVIFEGEMPFHLTAQEFRQLVGFNKLKSTHFQFQWFGDSLRISGKGHGHGVGLCQWGAKTLAQNGNHYRDILKHYYPNASLRMPVDVPQPRKAEILNPPHLESKTSI